MEPQNRKISSFRVDKYNDPIDRYQSLTIKESLSKSSQYTFACRELSFLLKNAFSKFPKNLQSLIFQDTLFAFTLLPQMQTKSAISAANSLLQSAEFALPKQKRALAVTEYKHAVVASKRKSKANKREQDLARLPQDVLVHVYSFLDVQSLLSASSVCQSWNAAASENHLWKLLYNTYFCNSDNVKKNNGHRTIGVAKNENKIHVEDDVISGDVIDFRFAFKAAYRDARYRKFESYRGYCSGCCLVVWLNSYKCSNEINTRDDRTHQIKPISVHQIVEFVLDGFPSSESSSDSDSDSEDASIFRLWAYPRQSR